VVIFALGRNFNNSPQNVGYAPNRLLLVINAFEHTCKMLIFGCVLRVGARFQSLDGAIVNIDDVAERALLHNSLGEGLQMGHAMGKTNAELPVDETAKLYTFSRINAYRAELF
jgi:hypothetical protein